MSDKEKDMTEGLKRIQEQINKLDMQLAATKMPDIKPVSELLSKLNSQRETVRGKIAEANETLNKKLAATAD